MDKLNELDRKSIKEILHFNIQTKKILKIEKLIAVSSGEFEGPRISIFMIENHHRNLRKLRKPGKWETQLFFVFKLKIFIT